MLINLTRQVTVRIFPQVSAATSSITKLANMSNVPANAKDVKTLVIADHEKIRYLYKQYKEAKTNDQREWLAYTIIRELSMHSSKEEEVLYPAIKKAFGADEQKHLLGEHMELKEKASKLSMMDPHKDQAAFDSQLASLISTFDQHTKEEEEQELPKLISAPGIDAMQLGMDFEKAGAHAVTRPHTWAPDKAPLNWFTNRMSAPLDAAMDMARFGGNPPDIAPPPSQKLHEAPTTA